MESPIRIVCWNIERGYRVDKILEELKTLQGDILLLQEVDCGNERTQNKQIAQELADGLGLPHILYAVEFEEIYSPYRSPLLQGGGTHGNAIISRFPLSNSHIIPLPEACNWESSTKQPRKGGRIALACNVTINNIEIGCVSVHLENYCGPAARRKQYRHLWNELNKIPDFPKKNIIAGDMNTIVGGLGRFFAINPFSLIDIWERIKSIGYSEAEGWKKEMSDLIVPQGVSDDPFDVREGTIYQVFGLYQPKLDWILLSNGIGAVKEKRIGGNVSGPIGTRLSDHKWLFISLVLED